MRVLTIAGEALRQELADHLASLPGIEAVPSQAGVPELEDLQQIIRVYRPDCLLVDFEDQPRAEVLIGEAEDLLAGVQIVAVAAKVDPALTLKLMHMGVRECLARPIRADELREILGFVQKNLAAHPAAARRQADLFTFFPAKAGVGTSTVCLGTSCALAEELGARTLLLDCDLAAGIVKFHLKVSNSASLLDAIVHAKNLDANLWEHMMGKYGKLDVLHGGSLVAPPAIDPADLQQVLAFARARYEVICADLASAVDQWSIHLMRESRRIFLVTSPEVASVHLAQARVKSFRELGLLDRVNLVVNRKDYRRGHLDDNVIAEAVGIPVAFYIGNDYDACSNALLKGAPVPSASDVGRSIMNLARSMRNDLAAPPAEPHHRHKFLEFFHVVQEEDPITVWRD